ncbi:hypothetical protein [Burkholderia sp. AW49-1]
MSRSSYWRGRIDALLAIPGVPRHVTELGNALLAKIDATESKAGRDPHTPCMA